MFARSGRPAARGVPFDTPNTSTATPATAAKLSQTPGVAVGIGGALALAGIYLTIAGQGARTREAIAARDVE